MYVEGVK